MICRLILVANNNERIYAKESWFTKWRTNVVNTNFRLFILLFLLYISDRRWKLKNKIMAKKE